MFKLAVSPTFWTDVGATIADENGKRVPISFQLQFKRLTPAEIQELAIGGVASALRNDSEVLSQIVVGWKGIADEHGTEMEFSQEGLTKLIDLNLAGAIAQAFMAAQPRARAKN